VTGVQTCALPIFLPQLGLVVFFLPAKIRVPVKRVLLDQFLDRLGDCHYKMVALNGVKDVEI
jgi:hypothetical protein